MTEKLSVRIINNSGHPLPSYATVASAGVDLRACLTDSLELNPMERKLVPTGLYIELPPGYEAQVRPRSGMALKQGITVLNSPGTIDADYRGEIMVLLVNFSTETSVIHNGERVAQMVIARHKRVDWLPVDSLEETDRGAGGYGHTGKG